MIDAQSNFPLIFVSIAGLAVMAKTLLSNPRLILLPLRAHGATNFTPNSCENSLQLSQRAQAFFEPRGPMNVGHGLPKEGLNLFS